MRLALAGVAAAAVIASCSGSQRSGSPGAGQVGVQDPVAQPLAVSPEDFPLVSRAADGLEVQWWIADDTGGAVGTALVDLADGPAPLEPELARAWIANGFRMTRVSLAKLGELQRRLPPAFALDRTWHGWATTWTPVFTGKRVERRTLGGSAGERGGTVLMDDTPVMLEPGVLRIIARSWGAPSPSGARLLRLELVPQLQTSQRDEALASLNLKGVGPKGVQEEGRLFERLALDTALEPGWVYVVAPETPGVEWKGTSDRRPPVEADPTAGPKVDPLPTLGEAMMSVRPGEAGGLRRPLKAVLVLVPR